MNGSPRVPICNGDMVRFEARWYQVEVPGAGTDRYFLAEIAPDGAVAGKALALPGAILRAALTGGVMMRFLPVVDGKVISHG